MLQASLNIIMQSLYCLLCILCSNMVLSFKIEGKVAAPSEATLTDTRVLVEDGLYTGYLRSDGSFAIHNVPTGTYVIRVSNPVYFYEPLRVDISPKGSIRARKLNNLKPSAVSLQKYPLDLKPLALMKYFQVREKFSVLDMLKSPMVLMMVLPMVLLFILPKMMNASDPETRREMENSMSMFNQNSSQMPDMAELLSKYLGGNKKPAKSTTGAKTSKGGGKRRKNE